MAVKVVIKRMVADSCRSELDSYVSQMRQMAMRQSGFFYGETLTDPEGQWESIVVTTWQSRDHWDQWFTSAERTRIQALIDALPESRTEYEIHMY